MRNVTFPDLMPSYHEFAFLATSLISLLHGQVVNHKLFMQNRSRMGEKILFIVLVLRFALKCVFISFKGIIHGKKHDPHIEPNAPIADPNMP